MWQISAMINQAYEELEAYPEWLSPTGMAPAILIHDARHAQLLPGLKQVKDRGGFTTAQDEAFCVVFGMTAPAIGLWAVDHVVSLERIPGLLLQLAGSRSGVLDSVGAFS